MNAQQSELYQRLQNFSLDACDADFPFSQRLARENGWSLDYTRRVMEEYKKFAFLAACAGHPVSPSEAIDRVWHLHLTYTQSYWQEFCPQVLQMPFHHQPTRGGTEEQHKFHDWYLKTLDSYRCLFEDSPPTDIWTPPHLHLRQGDRFVWVNARQNWIVPKPNWEKLPQLPVRRLGIVPVLLGLSWAIAGCQSTDNPLNFRGPEFLFFYSLVLLATILIAWMLRFLLRKPSQPPAEEEVSLDPYEIAYLAGGKEQAIDAVITSLVQQQVVRPLVETRSLQLKTSIPEDSHPLEKEVGTAIGEETPITSVRLSATSATESIRDRLQESKLLVDREQSALAKLIPALAIFAVLLLGVGKIIVGIGRDKPIGFLLVFCIVTLGISIAFLVTPIHRSRYGDRVLADLEKEHSDLYNSPDDSQLVLAFALFGSTVLTQDAWQDLHRLLTPPPVSSSSGSSSGCGCGCGSGCGGGCGGCGGCGG